MGDRESYKLVRQADSQPAEELFNAKIIAVLGNSGSYSYTIQLGWWDMTTSPSTGGTWVPKPAARTFTAFAEDLTAASPLGLGYYKAKRRGRDTAGNKYYTIISGLGSATTVSGKITGNAAGNGKYTGKSFTDAASDVSASGNLAEADFGTLAAANDCLVLNPVELGVSNTGHDVTAATNTAQFAIYFTGRLVRVNTDGTKVVHAMMFYVGC